MSLQKIALQFLHYTESVNGFKFQLKYALDFDRFDNFMKANLSKFSKHITETINFRENIFRTWLCL